MNLALLAECEKVLEHVEDFKKFTDLAEHFEHDYQMCACNKLSGKNEFFCSNNPNKFSDTEKIKIAMVQLSLFWGRMIWTSMMHFILVFT